VVLIGWIAFVTITAFNSGGGPPGFCLVAKLQGPHESETVGCVPSDALVVHLFDEGHTASISDPS
jgi:hypothetical protein